MDAEERLPMNEVENTFRALKDENPLATSRFCWLGFHKWTKYSGQLHRKESGYDIDYQVRNCAHCGLMDFNEIRKY